MTPFWPVAPQTVTATGNGKSNGKISENVRSFTKWSSAKTQVTHLHITSHHVKTDSKPWSPKCSWVKPKSPHASPSHPFHPHATQMFCQHIIFQYVLLSSPEAKILHLSYLSYNKVTFAHTTYGKQNWISQTDICTLKQQLIDSNLCQTVKFERNKKNLWNAWVDT